MKLRVSPLVFVFVCVMLFLRQGVVLVGYLAAVVLHEMAHAEVAKRRGYALTQMKLMPYGAALSGQFEGAGWKDEVCIAAAGPLMNLILAVLCVALWWIVPVTYFFTETFVLACVCTALTNLLPVFPLDGGRALLAVMSRRVPRQRAYKVVRVLGYLFCTLFSALFVLSVFYGLNLTFALMAVFLLTGTLFPDKTSRYQRLYSMAFRSEKLKHGLPVRETMVLDSLSLYALSKMLNGNYYQRFIVVNERLEEVGTLGERALEDCLCRFAPQTPVGSLPPSVYEP